MIKRLLQGCLPVGLLILSISHICAQYLSMTDFVRGFFEGMSAVFMVIGLMYFVWYFAKKENPYMR